jgi:uncharacterized protein (DUF2267 family)
LTGDRATASGGLSLAFDLTVRTQREGILEEIVWRAPLRDRQAAEAVLEATLEILGQHLSLPDAATLGENLPPRYATLPTRAKRHASLPSPSDLFAYVAERENVSLGLAVEHAQVVLGALAESLGADARAHLQRRLPPDWAVLFTEPVRSAESDVPHGTRPGHGHTLAAGKPGSAHPLAEARPTPAHRDSVAASDNPHAETKVSSGAPDPGDSLAAGRPGADHSLADAKDERPV